MGFEIIDKKNKILQEKSGLMNRFYGNRATRYILGINEWTDRLVSYCRDKGLDIAAIIDDYTNEKSYHDLPIIKMEDVDNKKAIIISCVIYGKLITAWNNLEAKGMHYILNYLDLCLAEDKLNCIHYCSNNNMDIENNKKKYEWLYEVLADICSKNTLQEIIDFRYNYNIEAMKNFKYNLSKQYFDDLIKFNHEETFVDCGGFDGETTKKFIELCPNYKFVYYFEPSKEYFAKSQEKLKQYKNIYYFNKGTYEENTILGFSSNGSASCIVESGSDRIEVIRLDDVIKKNVTYIKLDVEGAEYESIIGAEQLIKTYKPKLAVCVYHKQEDFWRIPELVLSYRNDYKIYLRHYTEGLLETVMYFL